MSPTEKIEAFADALVGLRNTLDGLVLDIAGLGLPTDSPIRTGYDRIVGTYQRLQMQSDQLRVELRDKPSRFQRWIHFFNSRHKVSALDESLKELQKAIQNLSNGVRASRDEQVANTLLRVQVATLDVQGAFSSSRGSGNASTPNLSRSQHAYQNTEPVPSLPLSPRQRGLVPPSVQNVMRSASTTDLEVDPGRMASQDPHIVNAPPVPFNFQSQGYTSPYGDQIQGTTNQRGDQVSNTARGQFIATPGRHAPTMSAFDNRRNPQVPAHPLAPPRPTQPGVIAPPAPPRSSRRSISSGHSSQSSVYPNSSSSGHSTNSQGHSGGPYAASSISGHSGQSLYAGAPPSHSSQTYGGHGYPNPSAGAGIGYWQGTTGGILPTTSNQYAQNPQATAPPHLEPADDFDDMYASDDSA